MVYGTYLYSHNVHPHRGQNTPKSIQSYPVALTKAQSQGTLVPFPPKTKNPDLHNSQQDAEKANIHQKFTGVNIYPEPNNVHDLDIERPNLMNIEKFGGEGIDRATTTVYRSSASNVDQSNAVLTEKSVKTKKRIAGQVKEESNKDSTAYEEWVVLKQEQQKAASGRARPSSAVTGKKVRY